MPQLGHRIQECYEFDWINHKSKVSLCRYKTEYSPMSVAPFLTLSSPRVALSQRRRFALHFQLHVKLPISSKLRLLPSGTSQRRTATPRCHSMEIFILSGQSNMSGRGGVEHIHGTAHKKWDGKVPAECEAEPGSILRLNHNLEWEEAHEPLHADIDSEKPCGVGPGLVFAASLLRARKYKVKPTAAQIGLVPCAWGGSAIAEWERGQVLYDRMIARTKAAMQSGGPLRALLWYQGESDADRKSRAEQYERKLITFCNHLREDLQAPDLPIFQVAIYWPGAAHPQLVEQVRNAQKAACDQVKHLYLVDAFGLPLLKDGIHLTTEAQTKVGLMLMNKYISTGEGRQGLSTSQSEVEPS